MQGEGGRKIPSVIVEIPSGRTEGEKKTPESRMPAPKSVKSSLKAPLETRKGGGRKTHRRVTWGTSRWSGAIRKSRHGSSNGVLGQTQRNITEAEMVPKFILKDPSAPRGAGIGGKNHGSKLHRIKEKGLSGSKKARKMKRGQMTAEIRL